MLLPFCSTLTSHQLFIWVNTDNKYSAREFIPTLLSKKHINCANTSTPSLLEVIHPLQASQFSPLCSLLHTVCSRTHCRVIQIYNSSILGNSWNLHPSISEGLNTWCSQDHTVTKQSRHTPSAKVSSCSWSNQILEYVHTRLSMDTTVYSSLDQYFSTAGSQPATGLWHQLYRAVRGSPGRCHFSFLSIFHE